MSSFAEDSANRTHENPLILRNSVSTTKKAEPSRKYTQRKYIHIEKINFEKELKELEEASGEPIEYQSDRNEPLFAVPEGDETDKVDSFQQKFPALCTITPAEKPKSVINVPYNDENFATPKPKAFTIVKKSNHVRQTLEPQFAIAAPLGENNRRPRVQCSVDMNSGVNTPIHLLTNNPNTTRRIKVNGNDYQVLYQLGKGGSSEVCHCIKLKDGTHCALKCVSLMNPTSAEGYIKEVKILQKLQTCDRIIKMYDYEINTVEKCLYVVLEVGGRDLSKILKELPTQLPFYLLIYYWMEMLLAVQQMHSKGIIHADLKPANFLHVDHLKLIDFGISSVIESDMTSVIKQVPEGSYHYISPEALNDVGASPTGKHSKFKISFKSDVWSLGCILYQLVYKRTPFQNIPNTFAKFRAISDPGYKINYPEVPQVPWQILETIKSCLNHDIKSRPSIDDLIRNYECFL